MTARGPRHSKEEFARRGQEIYDRDVRPHLKAEDDYKLVAIDIETGMWEMDRDGCTATERLYARNPDAQPYLIRVGQPATFQISPRILRGSGERATAARQG
jgi:hypothetical protein